MSAPTDLDAATDPGRPAPARTGGLNGIRGHVAVFLAYLLLWIGVSWPLVTVPFSGDRLVTRQFDLYPSMWLVDAAPGTFPRMMSMGSAWPVHELLARADSYVLLGLGWLNQGLFSGATVCATLALFGVPISAWCAERCASHGFGVPRPWSLLAGLAYGFSGVAATAMLEGHVYHLLNPWLPLIWWAWQRANRTDGLKSGLLIGGAVAGALYTTAYFGLFALALLAMLTIDAPRVAQRVAPGIAAIAVPAGLYYIWLFRTAARFLDTDASSPAFFLRMGTVSAAQLIGWDGASDLTNHSITGALPLMAIPLALCVVACARKTRVLPLLLALGCVLVALGRTWHWDAQDVGLELPVQRLLFPQLAYFRFPVRALWLAGLVFGVQGARTLGAIGESSPRWAMGALVLAAIDAVVGPGLPWRLSSPVAGVPSVYASAPEGRAVLDLWAQPADGSSGEMEMWARNLTCYYAGQHQRPTPEVCIGTGVRSPREVLDAWLTQKVLAAADPATDTASRAAVKTLGDMGFGAVALHPDLYRPADAVLLQSAFSALFGPPVESTDAGEHVVLYTVPAPTETTDPQRVYRERVLSAG